MSATRAKAIAAWGDPTPDWILVLADEVERTTIRVVAGRVGFSPSVISQIVHKTYKGRIANIEAAVRGAFMGSTVECPVLDEIAVDLCLANQKLPFSAANPVRVSLHKACPTCRHNRTSRSKPEEKQS